MRVGLCFIVLLAACDADPDAAGDAGAPPSAPPPDAGCATVDALFPGPCETLSQHGDGPAVRDRAYTYDADGRTTSDTDGRHTETWKYDEHGELLEYTEGAGADIRVRSVCEHTYDGERLVLSSCDDGPGGPDGTPETVTTQTWDEHGRLAKIESDGEPPTEAPDGTPDSAITYTYDAAGNVSTRVDDWDANETPDRVTTHTWNARGQELTREVDTGADGMLEERFTWTYDDGGHLIEETRDQDGDGAAEWQSRTTWDAEGRITRVDTSGPGAWEDVVTVVERRAYDAGGRLDRTTVEWSDGSRSESSRTYDAEGWLREITTDTSGVFGGDVDRGPVRSTEAFDCVGNPVRTTSDQGADGTVEDTWLNEYDDACWPRP